ncbi:hypothetical protein BO94DRAFT_520503 [Aspergillus sclerotioniger CBS 115572]|uniref:Uncharacterized protein n=1 Tax=Aspergillus sclerotioniger CBS 115572 TaxID=1450535 RepID=A0A317W6J2_9EURO|nr:hypothetical protein BO94DRAFT_520503 [Aspergillus sclerotioniger CBS 115572]PWY81719.1 hypothetical protein BO94DRAFT_520503 [Aspergillus sclerotioniger CBS 115572]
MYESSSAALGLDIFADPSGIIAPFSSLLPASYRTTDDNIEPLSPELFGAFLNHELLVQRLNDIHNWLWMCGRPMPPRPLHQQVAMSRSIVVTEQMDMHLVWMNNQFFIKPLPAYLFHPDFWHPHEQIKPGQHCCYSERIACARGFLFSYTALITYPSDFHLAQQQGLLPSTVTWERWRVFSAQFLSHHCYAAINPRFWYGELRLSRLNKVYALTRGWMFRGYSRIGGAATYEDLLRNNFAALATVLGYVVIVLTAMQAGLSTDRLQHDRTFVNASYGFTVFSIIAPLIGAVVLLVGVLCIVASNWIATKGYERKRFVTMGVEPLRHAVRVSS